MFTADKSNHPGVSGRAVSCSLRSAVIAVVLFLAVMYSASATAQEPERTTEPAIPILSPEQAATLPKESTQSDDILLLGKTSEEKLDQLQKKGSAILSQTAEWIDSFFDDPRYSAEENQTRAKLKLSFGYSRFDSFEFRPSIDLRIKLPRLENRASVFLGANDDSDFDTDSNPISATDKNENEELTVGVQYFLALGEKYNLSTDVGLSANYVYGGLRYRYLHNAFNDAWEGRFTNRLRYYSDDGWENKASYDLERYFGDRFFFRTTLTGTLAERFDGLPFSATVRLYQVLDIDHALLYDASSYFDTEPDFEVTDVQFKIRYRQRFYRDWLVLEVAPQITFPSDYDHQVNPGLVVKFELDFGYTDKHKAYNSIFKF